MRRVIALAMLALVVVGGVGVGSRVQSAASAPAAQSCDDWVGETNERLLDARSLIYPIDRPGAFEGSIDQAAQEMNAIAEEQLNADPPDEGEVLSDDIQEALFAATAGLSGDPNADVQILFAKAIIYNADARLLAVNETC